MERKKKKKVEVGAVPFALGVVVLSTTRTSGRATARRSGFRIVVTDAFENHGMRAALLSPRAALVHGVGVGVAPFGPANNRGSSSSCPLRL